MPHRKSQIAIEYAHRAHSRDKPPMVFWVDVGDIHRVKASYRKIANTLCVPGANDEKANVFRLVRETLSSTSRQWLLILDNLDDMSIVEKPLVFDETDVSRDAKEAAMLNAYIPISPNGKVLITSRNEQASRTLLNELGAQSGACMIVVSQMSEPDALAFIKARLPDIDVAKDEDARGLVKDLEYFPLAISQASAYILQEPLMTIRKYRMKFQESESSRISLLQEGIKDIRRGERPNYATLFTWNTSFEYIKSQYPPSAKLLQKMSLFSHQNIPSKLLEALMTPEEDFDVLMKPLLRYHLVTLRPSGESFDMHRFVQLATTVSLNASDDAMGARRDALRALRASMPEVTMASRDYYSTIAPHASEVFRCQFDQREDLLKSASVLLSMSEHWRMTALYLQADNAATRALAIRTEIFGEESTDILEAQYEKTRTLLKLTKGVDARLLALKIIDRIEKDADDEDQESPAFHLFVAKVYDVLGQALLIEGKYELSETWFRKALERHQLVGKHGQITRLVQCLDLVTNLGQQGRFSDAEDVCRSSMQQALAIDDEDDAMVAEFKFELGRICSEMSRYKEAASHLTEAESTMIKTWGINHSKSIYVAQELILLKFRQRSDPNVMKEAADLLARAMTVLGPTHQSTLRLLSFHGTLLNHFDKPQEALVVHEKVLALRRRVMGEKHPDTILSMYQLAVSYLRLKRFEKSDSLIANALSMAKEILGPGSTTTIMLMHDYAHALARKGKVEEAIDEQRACLHSATQPSRKGQHLIMEIIFALGHHLFAAQHYNEALVHFRDAEEIYESLALEKHDLSHNMRTRIAETLEKLGDTNEAENMLRNIVTELKASAGTDDTTTLKHIEKLADFLRRQGKLDEAELLYKSLIGTFTAISGPEHDRVLRNTNELALTFQSQVKLSLAEATNRRLLETRERILPKDNPDIFLSMNNLGMDLYRLKRYDEATVLLQKAVEGRSKVLGPRHEGTIFAQMNLFTIHAAVSDWSQADKLSDSILDSRVKGHGTASPQTLKTWAEFFDKWLEFKRCESILKNRTTVIDRHTSVLGESHPQTLRIMGISAEALINDNALDEARELFKRVYKPSPEPLALPSPKLTYCFQYGNLLKRLKEFKEMEAFARELLLENIKFYSAGSDAAQYARLILTTSLNEQFRYGEACEVFEEKVNFDQENHGLNSQEYRSSFHFLLNIIAMATTLSLSSKEIVLKYRDELLSTEVKSSQTAETLVLIARALLSKSHSEAAPTFSAVIELKSQLQGPQSEEVVNLRAELAHALFSTNHFRESAKEARQVLILKEKISGPTSPTTMRSRSDLAMILAESGNIYEAEEVGRQALTDRRTILGENNPETLITQTNYGSIQTHCGLYAAAERTLRSAAAKRAATRQPGQFNIIHTENLLAKALISQTRFADAEAILRHESPDGPTIPGPKHRWTMARTALLAQALTGQGRYAEAKPLAEDALSRRTDILGPRHLDTLLSKRDVASISLRLGDLDGAHTLAVQTLRESTDLLGPWHTATLDCVFLLGKVDAERGMVRLAEMRLRQALRTREEVLRGWHPKLGEAEGEYVLLLVGAWRRGGGAWKASKGEGFWGVVSLGGFWGRGG